MILKLYIKCVNYLLDLFTIYSWLGDDFNIV